MAMPLRHARASPVWPSSTVIALSRPRRECHARRVVAIAQMRKLAMALAAVDEKSHFDQPDFRVRGKIFAGLSRDGKHGTPKLPPESRR